MSEKRSDVVSCCIRFWRWFPTVFIFSIVSWSYFAYVVCLCAQTVTNKFEMAVYLIFYHFFVVMFVWSYGATVFSDPQPPPRHFYLSVEQLAALKASGDEKAQSAFIAGIATKLPVMCRSIKGNYRYCDVCVCIKPDRSHHCSVVGHCVLKMDHYCPWVNNTVGWSNYKFFVLFLGYAFLYCVYVASTSAYYFFNYWESPGAFDFNSLLRYKHVNLTTTTLDPLLTNATTTGLSTAPEVDSTTRFMVIFLFIVSLMFALSVVALFSYHIYLTLNNLSTVESFHAPIFPTGTDKRGFFLSYRRNIQQVFGNRPITWFLPIFTSDCDGVTFPSNSHHIGEQDRGDGPA